MVLAPASLQNFAAATISFVLPLLVENTQTESFVNFFGGAAINSAAITLTVSIEEEPSIQYFIGRECAYVPPQPIKNILEYPSLQILSTAASICGLKLIASVTTFS